MVSIAANALSWTGPETAGPPEFAEHIIVRRAELVKGVFALFIPAVGL